MKKLLLLFLMMPVVASVFADGLVEINGYEHDDYRVYKEEAAVILEAVDNTPIGEFTLNEMKEVAFDLSIPFQKMQFVKKSKIASAILPGLGQYMNNDPLGGTLFLISDIAVITGTLIGAYYLLPDELKFDSLDYFGDSRATIKAVMIWRQPGGLWRQVLWQVVLSDCFQQRMPESWHKKISMRARFNLNPNLCFLLLTHL